MSHYSVKINLPVNLRKFLAGKPYAMVQASNVQEAIMKMTADSEGLHQHFFDETGSLNRFIRIFINGRCMANHELQKSHIIEDIDITILLAMAGG